MNGPQLTEGLLVRVQLEKPAFLAREGGTRAPDWAAVATPHSLHFHSFGWLVESAFERLRGESFAVRRMSVPCGIMVGSLPAAVSGRRLTTEYPRMTEDQHRLELRETLARLAMAALDELARRESSSTIGPMQDLRHWRRITQTSFVALRHGAWNMPKYVSTVGWLDTFPEMSDVRKVRRSYRRMRVHHDPLLHT